LAAQAIENYAMREEWQLAEIQAGLAEADSQDFATAEDLGRVLAKYLRIVVPHASSDVMMDAPSGLSTRPNW